MGSNAIGRSYLLVVPKFDNLKGSIARAFAGVDVSSEGERLGASYTSGVSRGMRGLAGSGAVMGVFASLTQSAMSLVSSSVGAAASRLDTLNNYPKVMTALGYSSDEASASIQTMADHLDGLPTALDDMVGSAQGIAAVTGDLTEATDASLALNDMLLASGSSTQVASAAMEQFRQMLSKGRPDMQDWKSLTSAMPGQMSQLAKSMLGPTANANDLYTALGGGGAEATITMDELLQKMIELDSDGGGSMTSFADQARDATGGIEASFSNMKTAVTRGIAEIMDSIGRDNISRALKDVGKAFEGGLKAVGSVLSGLKPQLSSALDWIESLASNSYRLVPAISAVAGAFAGMRGIPSILGGIASAGSRIGALNSALETAGNKALSFSERAGSLGTALTSGPLQVGLMVAGAAIAYFSGKAAEARKRAEDLDEATDGLADASTSLSSASGSAATALEDMGDAAKRSAKPVNEVRDEVDECAQSQAELARSFEKQNEETQASIGEIDGYIKVIDELGTGGVDNAQDVARLQQAVKGLNDACGTNYQVDEETGAITEQGSAAEVTSDQIDKLAAAKERELKMETLSEQYKETVKENEQNYQALSDAQDTVNQKQEEYNRLTSEEEKNKYRDTLQQRQYEAAVKKADVDLQNANKTLADAQRIYDGSSAACGNYTAQMEILGESALDNGSLLSKSLQSAMDGISVAFSSNGQNMETWYGQLQSLQLSQEQLGQITDDEWAQIAASYDGSSQSIVDSLAAAGVSLDDTQVKAIGTASSVDQLKSVLEGWGEGTISALQGAGVDIDALSTAMANAGVSAETLNAVGSDNLLALAQSCNGDVDTMTAALATLNGQQLDDKHVTITEDGTALQVTSAVDEVGKHVDALHGKTVDLSVNDYITDTVGRVQAAINSLTGVTLNAKGGVRLAAGGIRVRHHADGAIATQAVPLDIVGEAGAEAIVPLTNRRYVRPFARAVASEVPTMDMTALLSKLDQMERAITSMGVYIDGRSAGKVLAPHVDRELGAAVGGRGL